MKRIGVINKIKYSGPGTKNIIYKDPSLDGYVYIDHFEISILAKDGVSLRSISPKYNRNCGYYLGSIVEYDDETNKISAIDMFRKLTDEERAQINTIYNKYKEMKEETITTNQLSNCSSLEELENTLSTIALNDSVDIILDGIEGQIAISNLLNSNGINTPKRK